MNQAEIQTKLGGMKKTRKALSIVTMVTAIVCMAVLLAYNFMSVTYLKSPVGTDYEQGFVDYLLSQWPTMLRRVEEERAKDPTPIE